MAKKHVRHGFGTVRPYLYGAYELPGFLVDIFGAREVERHEFEGRRAAHVELAIGDSALVVEAGELPPDHSPSSASVYVYVEDVDGVYQRALEEGAKAISAPEDKPYGERGCGFVAHGNTWWVATFLHPSTEKDATH